MEFVIAGATVGDHLSTRVFLVVFQLCIWDVCSQIGNNSVDKTDIAVARRTSYASYATPTLTLSCIQLRIFTLQKLFFFSCSLEKGLNSML